MKEITVLRDVTIPGHEAVAIWAVREGTGSTTIDVTIFQIKDVAFKSRRSRCVCEIIGSICK